jgi:hypothetical protein
MELFYKKKYFFNFYKKKKKNNKKKKKQKQKQKIWKKILACIPFCLLFLPTILIRGFEVIIVYLT